MYHLPLWIIKLKTNEDCIHVKTYQENDVNKKILRKLLKPNET